jgi:hypothetical protein
MLMRQAPERAIVRPDHRTTATLLSAALAVAVLGQGAFHPGPFLLVAALVLAAGVSAAAAAAKARARLHEPTIPTHAPFNPRPDASDSPDLSDSRPETPDSPTETSDSRAVVWDTRTELPDSRADSGGLAGIGLAAGALVVFALWVLARAALSGDLRLGVPEAAVAVLLAVALPTVSALGRAGRDLVRGTVLALGVVVATAGWIGTALHLQPLSIPGVGLWRASSTLTYANATAAVLVIVVILAVTQVGDLVHRRVLTAVLLLGLVATMSRGGALALAVGLAVLACSRAGRARLRTLLPVPVAAGLGFLGLLPSLPEGSAPQPLLALAGLAAGAALLLRGTPRLVAIAATPLLAMTGLVLGPLGGAPTTTAVAAIADTRLNGESSARLDLARTTWERFVSAPLTGIGPGRLDLTYVDHAGNWVHAWFTHLEYLQVAAETGLVGLALVLGAAAALAIGVARSRSTRFTAPAAGALAVLAALAVHSGLDFLWHIPAIPLLACTTVVLAHEKKEIVR